jgi:uncharacterized membrane protein YebE (DUF533 family)
VNRANDRSDAAVSDRRNTVFDPKKLLDDLLGSTIPGTESTVREKAGQATQLAKDNPIATGALAAVLLGTGAGRALSGTALKVGGLAAVAGLAYKAYQNYQSGKNPDQAANKGDLVPPPTDSSFNPGLAPQGESDFALTLVRAMIAAARADGRIDEAERKHIGDRLALSGIDTEAETFLMAEMDNPIDLDALVASAQTDAQKVEIYAASRLAIEPDTRAEQGYLAMLAGRLELPDALVDHVEATIANVND